MAHFVGSWKMEKQDGAEKLATFLELPEESTQQFLAMRPVIDVSKTGNTFVFKVKITDTMAVEHEVTLDKEFETTNAFTGEKSMAIAHMEGNKMVVKPVKETPKSFVTSDEIISGNLVVKMTTANGITCTQTFVKA
ncbi:fatty acid-binding protein, liver-like [Glandiceps talaboti]